MSLIKQQINYFVTEYKQPDFYRFNEDSIKLVNHVLSQTHKFERILDLGAGSGIIGIELANSLSSKELTLLEIQSDFEPSLKFNCEMILSKEVSYDIHIKSFSDWEPNKAFDLIVCNPPYFLPDHGQPNRDYRKQICRSFQSDSWVILIKKMQISLSHGGRAYIVVKDNPIVLSEIHKAISGMRHEITKKDNLLFIELSGLDVD